MSQHSKSQRWGLRLVRIAWVSVEVAILGWAVWLQSQGRTEEQILVFYALNVLSFPSGLLFYLLFSAVMSLFGNASGGAAVEYLLTALVWTGFFVAGYLQWFWLTPYLIRRMGGRTNGTS